jgi:hypothetical protein
LNFIQKTYIFIGQKKEIENRYLNGNWGENLTLLDCLTDLIRLLHLPAQPESTHDYLRIFLFSNTFQVRFERFHWKKGISLRNFRLSRRRWNGYGLHVSAMQNIRIYSELYPGKLDVGDATFNIMRIFRDHKDPRMRRLALVTLVTIGDDKTIAFLKRNGELELDKEECINKQCCCAAAEYYAKKAEEDEAKFLAKNE